MKSAIVTTKTKTNTNSSTNGKRRVGSGVAQKASARNIFSKTPAKISARTQFNHIKKALAEVELIEAGTIQPASLEKVLNEL